MKKNYTTVLSIAGSDSSGGAGIQADLKTFAALECYGLSVITALTAQNTTGVKSVYPLPERFITEQLQAILSDISIDAVKIGMLGSIGAIKTISAFLRELKHPGAVILDTVLGSSCGTPLLPQEAITLMKEELFPLATLITPNLPETALLTDLQFPPQTRAEIESSALELLKTGATSVLIKGGHGEGNECHDCLVHDNQYFWFSSKKITTGNTHGTGCTLSSAIAAFMAKGAGMENAVRKAKSYLNEALLGGADYYLGRGNGPLHHACRQWK